MCAPSLIFLLDLVLQPFSMLPHVLPYNKPLFAIWQYYWFYFILYLEKLLSGSSPEEKYFSASKHKLIILLPQYIQKKFVKIICFSRHLLKTFLTNKFLYIDEHVPNTKKLVFKVLPKSFIVRLCKENKEYERKKKLRIILMVH